MAARIKGTGSHRVYDSLATPEFRPRDVTRKGEQREDYCDAVNASDNCQGIRCALCLFNPCATDPKALASFKKWLDRRKAAAALKKAMFPTGRKT